MCLQGSKTQTRTIITKHMIWKQQSNSIVYLFIYGLYNDSLSSPTVSSDRVTSEWLIEKEMEGINVGLT
jgi:hypothetical protein